MELNIPFMYRTFLLVLSGIPVTIQITLVTLCISIPVAFFLALTKIYKVRVLQQLVTFYVSFVRGTPIVLQILIIYSLLPSLLNSFALRYGLPINVFDLNPIWYAFVVFSLNSTAVLVEVFRSALLTIDTGQLEAAYSVGLSTAQAYRRILLPQVLLVALPNICNVTIMLIKSTSLAFMMTVKEVTAIAKIEASYGYNFIEAYLDIFIVYILLCGITQGLFSLFERKLGFYRRTSVT